ncbi:MAG: hypothetical protein WC139_09860 [Candidatus Kapaibacterium sp.]
MKRKFVLIALVSILLGNVGFAQIGINKSVGVPPLFNFQKSNNGSYYINSIRYLLNVNDSLKNTNRSFYFQMSCTQYSFVGAFKQNELLFSRELNLTNKYDDELKSMDSYDTLNIYSYLNVLPDSVKYVFFNEDHLRPQTRVTILNSLEILYKKGFRYLFCEAVNGKDSLLNTRKYPVIESGWYTSEPAYGNLLREAFRLGFAVLSYEDTNKAVLQNNGKVYLASDRETEQANNILNFISKHKDAKILVLAGHSHINENKKQGWMASVFKLKSGLNPLTIEQTDMAEYTAGSYSNNLFKLFRSKYQNKLPVMLVNNEGKPYSLKANSYDITLFPSKTDYLNERPNWLINLNGNKEYQIDMKFWDINDTCLIQAINTNEDIERSIPSDQILIEDIKLNYALYLRSGEYTIRRFDKNGNPVKSLIVNVE